jgi:hypothetical protein
MQFSRFFTESLEPSILPLSHPFFTAFYAQFLLWSIDAVDAGFFSFH